MGLSWGANAIPWLNAVTWIIGTSWVGNTISTIVSFVARLADALWCVMVWKEDTEAFAILGIAVVQGGAGAVRLVTESSSISGLTFASIWYVPLASTIDTTHQGFAFCAITSSPSLLALANTRHHTVSKFRVTVITNSCIGNIVNA